MPILQKLLVLPLAFYMSSQQAALPPRLDPLDKKIDRFEVKNETLGDALGRLNQVFDISISIEAVLPEEGTIANPRLNGSVEATTVEGVLTWLCALDARYAWTRDDNSINFMPRSKASDPTYFFNRVLREPHFERVRRVDDAGIAVVHGLNDPKENLIFLGIGGTQTFAEPWTVSFNNITVRQALNRIARHLGPTYGWQIGGTAQARLIVFHYKLGGGATPSNPSALSSKP